MTVTSLIRESVLDAAAVLLPVRCAGCGEPDRSLCPSCRAELRPRVRGETLDGVPVWAALDYAGTARRVILAYKDGGRVDAAAALAPPLRAAVAAAQRSSPAPASSALLPVLIPSTRSAAARRGYHPTGRVLSRAHILVPPLWRALRLSRQTADQAGLSVAERSGNRAGSIRASPRLVGRDCLIVDDIVTSGATVVEAARAIHAVGGRVRGAAALARTPLRRAADAQEPLS